jgi:hypothetical protein
MLPERPNRLHVTALRACGYHGHNGMRHEAHRKTMLALAELGLVEERKRIGHREARWFLTAKGRDLLEQLGPGDAGD